MSKRDQHHSLHDSFFKLIFKQKKYLKELLRVIFPLPVLKHLDLDQMTIRDGDIIKRSGKQLQADLVATVGLKGNRTRIELTFIFEHKSVDAH